LAEEAIMLNYGKMVYHNGLGLKVTLVSRVFDYEKSGYIMIYL
jgi:hypothetical protein